MNSDRPPIDYSSYQQAYDAKCIEWRSEPVQERKCNDSGCIPVLIIIILAFLGIGGYYIYEYNNNQSLLQAEKFNIQIYAGEIATCVGLSIALSFIYIFLIKMSPKIMVYVMIGLTLGLLALLAIAGLIAGQIVITISMGVTFLIYGLILFCFRRKIQTGIVLIKVATNFISQRPSIFITPVVKVFLSLVVGTFFLFGLSAMIFIANKQSETGNSSTTVTVLSGVMVLFWLFFLFFFYYMMVFTIAVTCAYWYYGMEGNALGTAYKWFFTKHIGSVTFAAVVIAVITFIRMLADGGKRNKKNAVLVICACILSCLLRYIQALLKILNHNSVIVMSVTGQGFIDAAKTTIGLLSRNLPLLAVSNMISGFLVFWGIIFTAGIPCVLGYFLLGKDNDDVGIVISLIAVFSINASSMILSVLAQSVGSVYIFYCFDKKFKEQGYNGNNMPQEINNQLGNWNGDSGYNKNQQSYDRM